MKLDRKICVGMIAGAHGVRGLVRLRSFTDDPESIIMYGALSDERGKRTFKPAIKSRAKDFFVAALQGITSREEAEALRGVKLYVPRAALPKTRTREYYEADLVGLAAKDRAGKDFGKILAVHNYGGGPFLEIGQSAKDSFMLPFRALCVLTVDVKGGKILISVPDILD